MYQKRADLFGCFFLQAVGLLLIVTLLAGCTTSQEGDPTSSELTEPNATVPSMTAANAVLSSSTPVLSVTPMVTPPETSTPILTPGTTAFVTAPPVENLADTSTAAPTLTPLPTIPSRQRGQYYSEMMKINGDCRLPCWWGFELGETPIEKVRQFYTAFDAFITEQKGRDGRTAVYAMFVDPQIEDGIQVRHTFFAQRGIVLEAQIEAWYEPGYQIEALLEQLGPPAEVWMWTISDTSEGVLPADFLLYYPESGVLVGYSVFSGQSDDAVRVCFDGLGATTLHLWEPSIWNPDGSKGFVDRASESGSAFSLEGYLPLQEVTNWGAEQFYASLSDPGSSECLETPSNLWSQP